MSVDVKNSSPEAAVKVKGVFETRCGCTRFMLIDDAYGILSRYALPMDHRGKDNKPEYRYFNLLSRRQLDDGSWEVDYLEE